MDIASMKYDYFNQLITITGITKEIWYQTSNAFNQKETV